jgi:hypothetical protein
MAYLGVTPVQHNERLFPAALALLLAGLFSVLEVRVFGQSWPLTWLPFAVVALWPRQVGVWPTGLILLLGGLWVDWTSWGAPGQWPLVFLLTYAVIRPDFREGARGLAAGMSRFALSLCVGVPVLILTGWTVYESWPDWGTLGRGIIITLLLVPLLIGVRDRLAGRMSFED